MDVESICLCLSLFFVVLYFTKFTSISSFTLNNWYNFVASLLGDFSQLNSLHSISTFSFKWMTLSANVWLCSDKPIVLVISTLRCFKLKPENIVDHQQQYLDPQQYLISVLLCTIYIFEK